jgi:DNA-binding FadR family transcriptional regulator
MPVKVDDGPEVCSAFMTRAKRCLDEAIFGQDEAKLQILQFIAGKITNPQANGMSLLLIGPPGIGKTSLIKQGIAKALDWPFQFISLGGDSDASTFNGHQMVYEGSHCGKIVNSLVASKSMSMVLMFDELDKISSTPKGEEIQNLLVHLTDSSQNMEFEDKYLAGIPLDMSQSMFVFSANDINKIDRVLLDRFTVIHLEGYGSKEKLEIAEKFLLPGAVRLAAERATEQDIQDIEAAYAGMKHAIEFGGDYVTHDLLFHQGLLRACHNRMVAQMSKAIGALLRTSFEITTTRPNGMALSLPLHRAVLDAVIARAPDAAEKAVLVLIDSVREDIETVLDSNQKLPSVSQPAVSLRAPRAVREHSPRP